MLIWAGIKLYEVEVIENNSESPVTKLLKFQSSKEHNPRANYNFQRVGKKISLLRDKNHTQANFIFSSSYSSKFTLSDTGIVQKCFASSFLFWCYWQLFEDMENGCPIPIYTFENLSLSTSATSSFISSSHILFLSGKEMFFGTDQPWVNFYSRLINFSIAGFIMELLEVLWF